MPWYSQKIIKIMKKKKKKPIEMLTCIIVGPAIVYNV